MTKRNYLSNNVLLYVPEAKILKTVVDTAPLTVYKVRTKKNTIAYKFHSREQLRPTAESLQIILKALKKELVNAGLHKDRTEYLKEYHKRYRAKNRAKMNSYNRKYRVKHGEEINNKRRSERAMQKLTQQAMSNLPSHV